MQLFTVDSHVTDHLISVFPALQDHRTHSSAMDNKSPNECKSFITEVPGRFIFTDVPTRNNYPPNRAFIEQTRPAFRASLIWS